MRQSPEAPTNLSNFVTLCFVCAAVMRCLGIPSRCVSNFNSAHDTEENLRVDIYLNEYGEKLNSLSVDSIWYCQRRLTLPTPCATLQHRISQPQQPFC